MSKPDDQKFDLWCMVELFGHAKIAGRCTEQNIAGTNMLRVDVPETTSQPSFTRFFGSGAIYAINPVDEATAKYMADKLQVRVIEPWNIGEVLKKHAELARLNNGPTGTDPMEEKKEEEDDDHEKSGSGNDWDRDFDPHQ